MAISTIISIPYLVITKQHTPDIRESQRCAAQLLSPVRPNQPFDCEARRTASCLQTTNQGCATRWQLQSSQIPMYFEQIG